MKHHVVKAHVKQSKLYDKYTICGRHFDSKHNGDWKKCKKCRTEFTKAVYDDFLTKKHNFETINVEKEEIKCCNCIFTSYDLSK